MEFYMLKKYTFKSEKPGYNILFLGAVHGNEPAGTNAMFKVLEKFATKALTPLKGSVSFIPVCNPKAFDANVRQIDENLNRVVKYHATPQTYEQQVANELVEHIKEADIIIDLHSTHCAEDQAFIFSDYPDPLADKIASSLNIKYIVEGWPEIYANNEFIQDFSTGFCAHEHNKTCLTIECGYHFSDQAIQTAYYTILSTLLCLGFVSGYPSAPICQEHIVMDNFIIKTKEGKLANNYKHLDPIKQGEIIATNDDGTSIISPQDGFILLPNHKAELNSECFYFGHKKK